MSYDRSPWMIETHDVSRRKSLMSAMWCSIAMVHVLPMMRAIDWEGDCWLLLLVLRPIDELKGTYNLLET